MSSKIYSYEVSVLRDGLSMDVPLVKYGQKFIYVKCFVTAYLECFRSKMDQPARKTVPD